MGKNNYSISKIEKDRQALKDRSKKFIPWFFFAPLFSAIAVAFLNAPFIIPLIAAILSIAVIAMIYFYKITMPFKRLKGSYKSHVLDEFMDQYHPNTHYAYSPTKRSVKSIVKKSKLVSVNIFNEEDVIEGKMGDARFYLSEAHLQVTTGKSTHTTFKGILMQIQIPGRNFPVSQIKSKTSRLARMFTGFVKHERYGFSYESEAPACFLEELEPLFPFIRHLMKEHKGLRIKIDGDTITLMLDTDMEFMDEPKPSLHESFKNKEYYNKLGRQLNSLFFIMESFVNNLNTTEIEEKLDLKVIEWATIDRKNKK